MIVHIIPILKINNVMSITVLLFKRNMILVINDKLLQNTPTGVYNSIFIV